MPRSKTSLFGWRKPSRSQARRLGLGQQARLRGEPLEERVVLNAAPVAQDDSYTMAQNTTLRVDDPAAGTYPGLRTLQSINTSYVASGLEYSDQYHRLFVREGVGFDSRIHVINTLTGAEISTRGATELFTDFDLTPDGRYLYAADFGEETSSGDPIRVSKVHRYDALTGTWEVKQAPRTAYRIEAIDSDQFLLHSKNQIITLTLNSFGSAPSTSFTEIDDMWSGNYYGDFEYDDTTGRILTSLENLSVKGPGAKQILNNQITGREAGGYSAATGYGGTATLSTNHLYYYYGEAQVTAADVRYTQRIFPQEIRAAGSGIAVGSSSFYSERTAASLGSFGYTPTTATISDVAPILWVFQPTVNRLHQMLIPDYGAGVLSNDADADLDRMTTQLMSDPAHGVLTLDAGGTFVYTPNAGYSGTDTFTYRATDGALSSTVKTVTINITPLPSNTAPVAVNDAYSVTTNTPLVIDAVTPPFTSSPFPGLHEVQSFTTSFSASQMEYSPQYHLLFVREGVSRIHVIDTQTQSEIAIQQAGESFTDMDLSADGRYLYVAEYGEDRQGYVRRFDAQTQTWEVKLANTYLAYYIEAVDGDRFLAMSRDQAVIVTLNSWGPTGSPITELYRETPSYYGDMEYDGATGRIYFGNSGLSTPFQAIAVLQLQGNTLIRMQGAGTPGYGNSNVLSADGKYFFYGKLQVLASNPNTWLHDYPEAIKAATSGLGFGDSTIYNTWTGAAVGPIGFSAMSYATTENAPDVWMYEPGTNRLHQYRIPNLGAGVLSNDSDANNDQLYANVVGLPTHGTLNFSSDGFFTYTPDPGYNGSDSFTYRASDGQVTSNLATVNLAVFTPPTVTLGISTSTIAENGGSATITATLSTTCIVDVTVNLARSGTAVVGTDYTLPDTIIIPAGSLTANVTLASISDTTDEVDDTIIIDIGSVMNGIESGTQQVSATIPDDDPAPAVQFSATASSASEGVGTANITIELSNPSDRQIVVPLTLGGTATSGTDYTAPALTVTFAALTSTRTISIPISNDSRDELDETITLTIGTPTNALIGTNSLTTLTIQDDDPTPTVSFSGTGHSFTEANTNQSIIVQLSAASNLPVTLPFTVTGTASNPADYTLNVSSPITINAGLTTAVILVQCIGDIIDEPNETVIVTMGEPTNAGLGTNTAYTVTITDNDSAPTVSFAASTSSVREGASLNIQLNLSSASGFDITVPFTFTGTAASGTDYTLTTPLVIPAGNATYQATLATVGDGVTEGSETAIVTMGTPTNASKSGITVHTATIQNNTVPSALGESYSLLAGTSLSVSAPGLLANDSDPESNPLTAVLGTGPSHGNLSLNADGSFTYTPVPTYSGADSFTYKVSDGALQTAPVTVNLTVNALHLPTFTPTPTGFIATFDQDLNINVLNLFDQDSVMGTSDVTLVGNATGAVRGSLVIDATARKVTFVASGGILPPDNYTATFRSATSGFTTPTGSLLDGNNDGTVGDNAVRLFTVTAPATNAVVLSVSDFVRGYGQAVNLPANGTMGLPITLSSGQGITGLDFKLLYDPTLLSIASVTAATGISAAVTYNTNVPGELVVTVSSATQFSSSPGAVRLLNITAQVPQNAPYASKQVLDLTGVHIYDASASPVEVPAIDDDGLHIAAYFGDSNGSQTYNSPDATAVQRIIVGSNSGLLAYPLADPNLIVDISGNGSPQSNDVTLIQRAIVGSHVDEIPPHPGLTLVTPAGADPIVYVPQNLSGAVGQTITVPIDLLVTESTGITLAGVDLAIAYDASKFELTGVQAGQLAVGFGLNVNTSMPGIVRLSLAADAPLDLPHNLAGTLAELHFTILSGAGSSSTINLLAQSAGLHTALYDDLGRALLLIPAPTDGDSDAVDGRVQIDWPQAVDAAFAGGDDLA